MNEQIESYIEKFPAEIAEIFQNLRQLIYDSVSVPLSETMWAKMPSYYAGNAFVRLIPFKDHVNIEAKAAVRYQEKLTGYHMTPKGMLQIYANQNVPDEILRRIFAETLEDRKPI